MKTKMLRNIVMTMIVLLPALVNAEQLYAVNYKNTYKGQRSTTEYRVYSTVGYQPSEVSGQQSVVNIQTTIPTTTFQSTSSYSGQWQQAAQAPMINADGTVNTEAYGVGRTSAIVRRSGSGSGVNPGTPDDDEDDEEEQQPIGDGLWPLMICACAYLFVRATRKKEKIG